MGCRCQLQLLIKNINRTIIDSSRSPKAKGRKSPTSAAKATNDAKLCTMLNNNSPHTRAWPNHKEAGLIIYAVRIKPQPKLRRKTESSRHQS